jgi:hypothetical protein
MPGRLCAADLQTMKISFSQHGEDLVILEHLQGLRSQRKGIYIDAGCFDPFVFSNTRLLNLHGWQGINIDVAADVIEKFQRNRPYDHNVCAPLSNEKKLMYLQGEPGTASRRIAASPDKDFSPSFIEVSATTLTEVLANSPFSDATVDFLDVDCETHDLPVLEGFPFEVVRPKIIALESHGQEEASAVDRYLSRLSYTKIGTRGPTHLFRAQETLAGWP